MPGRAKFSDLPDEILREIFKILPLPERGRFAQVNKRLFQISVREHVFADLRHHIKDFESARAAARHKAQVVRAQNSGVLRDLAEACEWHPRIRELELSDLLEAVPSAAAAANGETLESLDYEDLRDLEHLHSLVSHCPQLKKLTLMDPCYCVLDELVVRRLTTLTSLDIGHPMHLADFALDYEDIEFEETLKLHLGSNMVVRPVTISHLARLAERN